MGAHCSFRFYDNVSPNYFSLYLPTFLDIVFSGNLSLRPDYSSSYVFGGILAGMYSVLL